ncbi:ABC transporter permease [Paenibacillus sp. FSL M8-0334]|uniref:ABC transporter permease n=1 Tax=Paenibacillus campinasensis TaxID=66347 RepID=A0ABW9T3C3_9BACL|nr:ABC transporter permease [Paenibacillus campinasensis]MUG67212.1 ABC transporter permease [Paenibacillus campinasensis]
MNNWRLIRLQCRFELLRMVRNPYYIFWSLTMPIAFYVIFTRLVTGTDAMDAGIWQAHYLMSMTVFSVMGTAIMNLGIPLVQERAQGWAIYMRVTPLPGSVYFIAKMFVQTVMHLLSIIVIFTAGYLINGVSMAMWQWLSSGLWILLASAPFLAIGALIGLMKRVETASGVSNGMYLGLALTGGLWFPMEAMPSFMQVIGQWMPSYHFGSGAWAITRAEAPGWEHIVVLTGYFAVFMLLSTYIRKKQQAA